MDFIVEQAAYHSYCASNFRIDRPKGPDAYAFVHFLRPMEIYLNDRPQFLEPGAFIVFAHGFHQHYHPQTTDMLENWCHFDCPDFSDWLHELGLPINQPFYIRYATAADAIFHSITLNYHSGNTKAVNYGMQALFCSLAADYHTETATDPALEKLYHLRSKLYLNPEKDWDLKSMAMEISFSESHLNKLYRRAFGISPKKDLFRIRMERAKYFLSTTPHSVEYIAHKLNYASSTSFISQFHKAAGISPLQYRKQCH